MRIQYSRDVDARHLVIQEFETVTVERPVNA